MKIFKDFLSNLFFFFFWGGGGGLLQLECKHFAQKIARYEMIKRTEIIMHFSLKKKVDMLHWC